MICYSVPILLAFNDDYLQGVYFNPFYPLLTGKVSEG